MHKSHYTLIAGLLLACSALPQAKAQEAGQEQMRSMVWPMQPGESLHDLAALIYPKNRAMQQRMIAATLRLNGEALAGRTADQPFEAGQDILLPDLHALSAYAKPTHKHKSAPRQAKPEAAVAAHQPAVQTVPLPSPDASALEQRNQSRKQDLDALNKRLDALQTEAAKMQQSIEKNKAALPSAAKP